MSSPPPSGSIKASAWCKSELRPEKRFGGIPGILKAEMSRNKPHRRNHVEVDVEEEHNLHVASIYPAASTRQEIASARKIALDRRGRRLVA